MGFHDLLSDRDSRGQEAGYEESLKRREERQKLKRKIFKAFTGKELEPGKESIKKPEPKKTIEGDESWGGEEEQSVPDTFESKLESIDPHLYRAVLKGDINLFKELTVSNGWLGPRLEIQASPQGNTVLHVAASSGRAEIVEPILQCCFSLLTSENSDGDTPLHLAARGGHFSTVVAIIDCAKQLHASSSRDIESGRWEFEYILTVKNNADNNALHEALKKRHESEAKFLIEQEPKIWGLSNGENKSPLYLAAEAGFLDLVNHIANNSKQNQSAWLEGMSPAIAAIIARRKDILTAIMQLPAKSRGSPDEFGRIPYHYAAWCGYVEAIVCLLGESTVDACKRDVSGLTPLHIAATNGHVDVIKKLLEYCPYPEELLDQRRQNILHAAAECGKENVVTYVLKTPELERLINARDIEGRTPLHLATLSGHPKILIILTNDKRIDMKAMTEEGYTALDIATQEVKTKYSFRRRLTWIALRAANAPSSKFLNNLQQDTRLEIQERWGYRARERARAKSSMVGSYKDRVHTFQVVATLIATVTFAAGFQLPGGYNSNDPDKGVATDLKEGMFQAYVICDTISLYSSIIVVLALMWAQLGDVYLMRYVLHLASPLLGLAFTTMTLAFMTGVYLAVSKLDWLGVVVLLIGSICLFGIIVFFVPLLALTVISAFIYAVSKFIYAVDILSALVVGSICLLGIFIFFVLCWFPHYSSKYGIVRYMSYYVFLVLQFATGSSTAADYDDLEGASTAYSTK